jgi:hypothetical protein
MGFRDWPLVQHVTFRPLTGTNADATAAMYQPVNL